MDRRLGAELLSIHYRNSSGVVGYSFDNFEANATQTAAITPTELGRETTSLGGGKSGLDIVYVNVDFRRVDNKVGSDHEPLLATFELK